MTEWAVAPGTLPCGAGLSLWLLSLEVGPFAPWGGVGGRSTPWSCPSALGDRVLWTGSVMGGSDSLPLNLCLLLDPLWPPWWPGVPGLPF
jgi:hypothetical protein